MANKKTAEKLFQLLKTTPSKKGISIYDIDVEYGIGYRCDCGETGSFELIRYEGYEEYSLRKDDWVYVDVPWLLFRSLDELYEGYPKLTIEQAINLIK